MTTAQGRTRNRRGEGGRLREQLVTAAGELLDETGDRGAITLRALARRVGVAATSIYAHFDGPTAVLAALADDVFAQLARCLEEAAIGPTATARLVAVCDAYVRFGLDHPHRYGLLFAGGVLPRPVPGATIDSIPGAAAFGVLLSGVRECVAAGESESQDPFTDAVAVWVGLHGYVGLQRTNPAFPWPDGGPLTGLLVARLARLTG